MTTDNRPNPRAPMFSRALRGYDPGQVDEHISRMQRVAARMQFDLEAERRRNGHEDRDQPLPPGRWLDGRMPESNQDTIDNFTDSVQQILNAATSEAAGIRRRARSTAQQEVENVSRQIGQLLGQRDALRAELTTLQAQIAGALPRLSDVARAHTDSTSDGAARQSSPGTRQHRRTAVAPSQRASTSTEAAGPDAESTTRVSPHRPC